MRLTTRIIVGFLASFVVLLATSIFTFYGARETGETYAQVSRSHTLQVRLSQVLSGTLELQSSQQVFVLTGDESFRPYYNAALEHLSNAQAEIEKWVEEPQERELAAVLGGLVKERLRIAREVIEAREKGGLDAAVGQMLSLEQWRATQRIHELISQIENREMQFLERQMLKAQDYAEWTLWATRAASVAAFLLLALGGGWLVRSIQTPVQGLLEGAERLGRGDLQYRIPLRGRLGKKDEFGQLADTFNWMAEKRLKAEESLRLISDWSQFLASTLDPETVLRAMGRMWVPRLADLCAVRVTDPASGQLHCAVMGEGKEKIEKRSGSPASPSSAAFDEVLKKGKAQLIAETPDEWIDLIRSELRIQGAAEVKKRSAMLVPVPMGGKVSGVILCLSRPGLAYNPEDIALTEELARRAGAALENSRLYLEAQRAIQARQNILAIVSHDLKNPLTAIRMNTELLAQMVPSGEEGEKMVKVLENLKAGSGQMSRMIMDLLDMSAIEAGKLTIRSKALGSRELKSLIDSVIEQMRPVAMRRGLTLVAKVPSSFPEAQGDLDRVRQVLLNLLGNAIKFTPEGGSVFISAEETAGDELLFSVRDTGPGISRELLPRLFTRFLQAEGIQQKGTGLGLFISKGIIDAHHGRIWVKSELGQGSTFFFTLPRHAHAGARSA